MSDGKMNDVVKQASAAQALAADPAASVFVSANAGTGKTKVLTDRVLRLLLAGAVADGVLCVTYTRAAAAEMRNRISARLAAWAVITTAELRDDLAAMGVANPSQEMIARARRLFAEILDNDLGPRVETVHSFCQSILSRFPIEAGIAPHTSLADDSEQEALRAAARAAVMRLPDPEVSNAVMLLAEQINEDQLQQVLASFVQRDTRHGRSGDQPSRDAETSISAQLEAHFRDDLGLGDVDRADARLDDVIANIDDESLLAVAAALQASGVVNQQKRAANMMAWLAQENAKRREKIDLLVGALFTNGQPRSTLSNKKIREELPAIDEIQQAIQMQLAPCMVERAAQRCRELTAALYVFGGAFQHHYKSLKRAKNFLDYDDLIAITNNLMARSEAAQWVAWKLDNGIQHLLIDEAQDTSPAQWYLLRRLSAEFFEDDGQASGEPLARTLFAVGDFKQSIYSFQGADPRVMSDSRAAFAARAAERNKAFRQVSLSVSFRSSAPVLDLVNAAIDGLNGIEDFTPHLVSNADKGGFVELMACVEETETPPQVGAFVPPKIATATGAAARSAQQIASLIKGWIGTRRLSGGRLMTAGDIMILLRKRGAYFDQLLAALRRADVPVAGADRMRLENQIEIEDLMALGDVVTLPEDDLQVAALLKSPLFGMDEETLFTLATGRGKASLFAALMQNEAANNQLGEMADKMAAYRNAANDMSVYAFYSFVLDSGGRQAFKGRLGATVDESLDHFLSLAQNFGHNGGASLTEFLVTLRATGGEIKRDLDSASHGAVRIMTIHGAKGLEAPVVILPDMLRASPIPEQICQDVDSGFVYWSPGSSFQPEFLSAAKTVAEERRNDEENRLLYVALTRAREGLVIGGWAKPRSRTLKDSDYALLADCLGKMDGVTKSDDGSLLLHHEDKSPPPSKDNKPPAMPDVKTVEDAPDWLRDKAPPEPPMARPIRPSDTNFDSDGGFDSMRLNGGSDGSKALAKGRLAHRLFEILPMIAPEKREQAAQRVIQNYPDLDPAEASQILGDVLRVMQDAAMARLFAPDALAEIPVNGVVLDEARTDFAGYAVAGQIDRLHVDANSVLFADFKTGVRPDGAAPIAYQRQIALYAALLAQIYPDHRIEGWIVWSEAAVAEEISAAQCTAALADIGAFN